MSEDNTNVVPLEKRRGFSGNNGGGGDVSDRLSRLETHMEYVAKTSDIQALESKMLKWMLGVIITTVLASCIGAASLIVSIMMP